MPVTVTVAPVFQVLLAKLELFWLLIEVPKALSQKVVCAVSRSMVSLGSGADKMLMLSFCLTYTNPVTRIKKL